MEEPLPGTDAELGMTRKNKRLNRVAAQLRVQELRPIPSSERIARPV